MRLIDIDAIPDKSYWCRDALAEAIETAPIIDAVPREKYDRLKENAEILSKACDEMEYVVRCKDCKWSDWYTTADGHYCYCMETGNGGRTENDYCSYGERGDSDDETGSD